MKTPQYFICGLSMALVGVWLFPTELRAEGQQESKGSTYRQGHKGGQSSRKNTKRASRAEPGKAQRQNRSSGGETVLQVDFDRKDVGGDGSGFVFSRGADGKVHAPGRNLIFRAEGIDIGIKPALVIHPKSPAVGDSSPRILVIGHATERASRIDRRLAFQMKAQR